MKLTLILTDHLSRPDAFSGMVGGIDRKGGGGTSVPSNGPDVNNLNKPWKHTGMDMCCCWRKHYSGVIENKTQQHLNPRGDRNRETQEGRQRGVGQA